jgi:hypothetical protein
MTVHLATKKWYRSDQEWTCHISLFSWHHSVCIIIDSCLLYRHIKQSLLSLVIVRFVWMLFLVFISCVWHPQSSRRPPIKRWTPSPHLQGCCSYVTLYLNLIILYRNISDSYLKLVPVWYPLSFIICFYDKDTIMLRWK